MQFAQTNIEYVLYRRIATWTTQHSHHEFYSLCPSIQSRTPHREPLANLSELSPNLPIAVYSAEKPCLIVKSGEKHDLLARETWSGTTRMATAKSWRCSPPAKMKNMHGRANVHRGFQIALPVAHNPWPTSLPIERPREGLRVGAIMR